jgi:hypothetical protein
VPAWITKARSRRSRSHPRPTGNEAVAPAARRTQQRNQRRLRLGYYRSGDAHPRPSAVADLPWPHNPSRCTWTERFEQLEACYPPSGHPDPAVGAHWFLTLTDGDFAGFPYHRADWHRIAQVSVDVFRSLADDGTLENVLAAVEDEFGDSVESRWCSSLFLDPIVCRPRGRSVTDGQHRACALRAGGAPLCVVDVGDEYVGEPRPADPRRRAAGDIASFWARYAGS